MDQIPHEHLHKRWFGENVIDWLQSFFKGGINVEKTHDINEQFTAIILQEKWECQMDYGKIEAKIDARASATVKASTSFGLTIITKFSLPLDLSGSYLYFKNKGEVVAVFTLDAKGRAFFESGDFLLADIPIPAASFRVPKILTVGPTFKLYASADADLSLGGKLQAKMNVAAWDIYQTYPMEPGFEPKSRKPMDDIGNGDSNDLMKPEFDYSIKAQGTINAHLKPALTFGIEVDPYWQVGNAKVELVADASLTVTATAEYSNREDTCPFTYGVYAGARLAVQAEVPSAFNWKPQPYQLANGRVTIVEGGSCPSTRMASTLLENPIIHTNTEYPAIGSNHSSSLSKRSQVISLLSIQ